MRPLAAYAVPGWSGRVVRPGGQAWVVRPGWSGRVVRPGWSGLRAHCLHGEVDGHLVADEDLAAVERDVEVHAPVLAVDHGGGLEADALVAPRVLAGTEVLDLELDRLGDALDRQL